MMNIYFWLIRSATLNGFAKFNRHSFISIPQNMTNCFEQTYSER